MKHLPGVAVLTACVLALFSVSAMAQNLTGSLSFNSSGSFADGVAQTSSSILLYDNDLTDGHDASMDVTDAPAGLAPLGPVGSAAFQWGVAASGSSYDHTSALWFEALTNTNVRAEEHFNIGYLHYRNGTIAGQSGASWVNLAVNLAFSQPLGISSINEVYGLELVNTRNGDDPIASADIVTLRNQAAPLNFTDASGNRYYLEISFKVDPNTIDGTLSTADQFKVFEGQAGRGTMQGRFTVTPIHPPGDGSVPEPSTALLAVLGLLAVIRRKR
jgi:PEP-CTERM motif